MARDYDALADGLRSRYGRLDGLVHNAGILGALAPIEHYDVPTWCRVLHVNLTAAFALTQVLLPVMQAAADASIVFTSSGVGRQAAAYWGAYAVSKFGIEALSGTLADELEHGRSAARQRVEPGSGAHAPAGAGLPSRGSGRTARPEDVIGPTSGCSAPASRGIKGQSLDCQPRRPIPSPQSSAA